MYSEVAVSLVSAIYNNKNEEHIVNVKNNGALDFMANDDVIEIACMVNKNGAIPQPLKSLDNDHIKGMMRVVKTYEKHTVKAGINGDYHEALRALLIHSLVGDFRKARMRWMIYLKRIKNFCRNFSINKMNKKKEAMMVKYVIGVDGGTTKTHYVLFDSQGQFVNFISGGPANHEAYPDSYKGVRKEIKRSIFKLLQQNRLKPEDINYAIFGLTGVDTKKQEKELSKIIGETGIRNFKVFNDAFLGIKAGSEKGYSICSINGTGTFWVGIDENDDLLQVGETGWTFGDEAGGHILAVLSLEKCMILFTGVGSRPL